MTTKKKGFFITAIVLLAMVFVSCGNPVKGKTYIMDVFGVDAAAYEFKSDGTYKVTSFFDTDVENGTYIFKNNQLILTDSNGGENIFEYNQKDDSLSITEGIFTITLKCKE